MQLQWKLLLSGLLLAFLYGACEKIDPESTSGPSLGEEAVVLTCEGCHVTRSYLRKLAVAEDEASSGGG